MSRTAAEARPPDRPPAAYRHSGGYEAGSGSPVLSPETPGSRRIPASAADSETGNPWGAVAWLRLALSRVFSWRTTGCITRTINAPVKNCLSRGLGQIGGLGRSKGLAQRRLVDLSRRVSRQ